MTNSQRPIGGNNNNIKFFKVGFLYSFYTTNEDQLFT